MKEFAYRAFPFFFLLVVLSSPAQLSTDITTGKLNSNGSQIPLGLTDDSWLVGLSPTSSPPNNQQLTAIPALPTSFQAAMVGNGVLLGTCAYPPPPANGGVRWISPYTNGSGQHLSVQGGIYFYRTLFSLRDCECWDTDVCFDRRKSIKFVKVRLDLYLTGTSPNGTANGLGAAYILINGKQYTPQLVPANLRASNPILTNLFIVPVEDVNLDCGSNTIDIVVDQPVCIGTSMGSSAISVTGHVEFVTLNAIKDVNGIITPAFCLEDNVYLDASGTPGNSFELELDYDGDGTGYVPLDDLQFPAGPTFNWINLTKVFCDANGPGFFATRPGKYRLKLIVPDPCNTGKYLETLLYFSLNCCENSADAAFEVSLLGSELNVESHAAGEHVWTLYSGQGLDGPFGEADGTFDGVRNFKVPAPTGSSPCYYIIHTLNNACGYDCKSRKFCEFACGVYDCLVSSPSNTNFDGVNDVLTWTGVPGATGYVVEIVVNDCCADPDDGTSALNFHKYNVTVNQLIINLTSLQYYVGTEPRETLNGCYEIKVYAVCGNGLRSEPDIICVSKSSARVAGLTGESDKHVFELIPNPSDGEVMIKIVSPLKECSRIRILDARGQVVRQFDGPINERNPYQLKIEVKGVYFVEAMTSGGIFQYRKLIIE